MLITIKQAIKELKVSESTIKRKIKNGELKSSKPDRIRYVFLPGAPKHPDNKIDKFDSKNK
jgi:excisionase family DNA binding protein